MELMQLEMFIAVAEERSVRKAAERVYRTQPAVSLALQKLEGELGTTLLDRSRQRGCQLTAAGEVLYAYASQIISLRNEALRTVGGRPESRTGPKQQELAGCAQRL